MSVSQEGIISYLRCLRNCPLVANRRIANPYLHHPKTRQTKRLVFLPCKFPHQVCLSVCICTAAKFAIRDSPFAFVPSFAPLPSPLSLSLSLSSEFQSSQKRAKGLNADRDRSMDLLPPTDRPTASLPLPSHLSPPIRKRGVHGKDLYQRQRRIDSNNVA